MLQLTPNAASVLRDVRAQQHVPDHFGIRVSRNTSDSSAGIRLNFVEEPVEGDQVSAGVDPQLFVAPEVAEPLADLALDVNMQSSASGLGLTLREQDDVDD
jgi:Fe-S cluster assembly iron-binding protein IscA